MSAEKNPIASECESVNTVSDQVCTVEVISVQTQRQLKKFINMPFKLYEDSASWIPPLKLEQRLLFSPRWNPFFEHGRIQPFLAADKNGRALGRIAAVINGMHLKTHKDKVGFFGFFECVDDQEVANSLFRAAQNYLKQNDLEVIRGPASPSLNAVSGLLVEGFFREPSVFMPYNPPYYQTLVEAFGFKRVMTMWSYFVHKSVVSIDRTVSGLEDVLRRNPGLKIRSANRRRVLKDLQVAFEIYNEAWQENWGHVPFTKKEFNRLFTLCRPILDPDLVLFLDLDGETIGFIVAVPDMNQLLAHIPNGRLFPTGFAKFLLRKHFGGIRNSRVVLMGVRKEYRARGFDVALCLAGAQRGLEKRSYDSCELSWILDTNKIAMNGLEYFGALKDKQYAIFEKAL